MKTFNSKLWTPKLTYSLGGDAKTNALCHFCSQTFLSKKKKKESGAEDTTGGRHDFIDISIGYVHDFGWPQQDSETD